jgi:hypothetical protein
LVPSSIAAAIDSGDTSRSIAASYRPQRECDARLGRQHRVTRGEHEPQQIVADVVVEGVGELAGDVARVGVALDKRSEISVTAGYEVSTKLDE